MRSALLRGTALDSGELGVCEIQALLEIAILLPVSEPDAPEQVSSSSGLLVLVIDPRVYVSAQ
jgi:hypothetical protein